MSGILGITYPNPTAKFPVPELDDPIEAQEMVKYLLGTIGMGQVRRVLTIRELRKIEEWAEGIKKPVNEYGSLVPLFYATAKAVVEASDFPPRPAWESFVDSPVTVGGKWKTQKALWVLQNSALVGYQDSVGVLERAVAGLGGPTLERKLTEHS